MAPESCWLYSNQNWACFCCSADAISSFISSFAPTHIFSHRGEYKGRKILDICSNSFRMDAFVRGRGKESILMSQHTSPFEAIRKQTKDGSEYWSARQLYKLLG